MLRRVLCLAASVLIVMGAAAAGEHLRAAPDARTALDEYVAAPDDAFAFKSVLEAERDGLTAYTLEFISQTWRSENEVDRTVWKHWLKIVVPEDVQHNTALLFISGGSNKNGEPEGPDQRFVDMAAATNSIVAELRMVPNQPLSFSGKPGERYEDDLIAYTWDKFLRTGDPTWLARFPMTKSAVRAMDAIQAFVAEEHAGDAPEHFVVAGASKRGWTTWTTAAVDSRVRAIAPIVIDMLNLVPSFKHHWSVYGSWAPAIDDYVEHDIMSWMGTPEFEELLRLVDPYSYRERLTIPKLILNAAGDQFFLPDSSQFYLDDLPGKNLIRYVPNADHGLDDSDAGDTLLAFYAAIIDDVPLPDYTWRYPAANEVVVHSEQPVKAAKLWQAHNPDARDFRLDTIGKAWESKELDVTEDGAYTAEVDVPDEGWRAYMVELTYAGPEGGELKVTTPVRVVPEKLPFEYSPPEETPRGFLSGQ